MYANNSDTRSSSLIALAQPITSSLLPTADCSFWYASPCLCNHLPTSLHQLHPCLSISDLPFPAPTTSSPSVDSPLSPFVTPSLFHSQLKTSLFHISLPRQTFFRLLHWLHLLHNWIIYLFIMNIVQSTHTQSTHKKRRKKLWSA